MIFLRGSTARWWRPLETKIMSLRKPTRRSGYWKLLDSLENSPTWKFQKIIFQCLPKKYCMDNCIYWCGYFEIMISGSIFILLLKFVKTGQKPHKLLICLFFHKNVCLHLNVWILRRGFIISWQTLWLRRVNIWSDSYFIPWTHSGKILKIVHTI